MGSRPGGHIPNTVRKLVTDLVAGDEVVGYGKLKVVESIGCEVLVVRNQNVFGDRWPASATVLVHVPAKKFRRRVCTFTTYETDDPAKVAEWEAEVGRTVHEPCSSIPRSVIEYGRPYEVKD